MVVASLTFAGVGAAATMARGAETAKTSSVISAIETSRRRTTCCIGCPLRQHRKHRFTAAFARRLSGISCIRQGGAVLGKKHTKINGPLVCYQCLRRRRKPVCRAFSGELRRFRWSVGGCEAFGRLLRF